MEEIEQIIDNNNIEFIRVFTEDLYGVPRGVTLDVDYFRKSSTKGISFPRVITALPSGDILVDTDFCITNNDVIYPDLQTFITLPWKEGVASVLCDFKTFDTGLPLSVSPRVICKEQLNRLKEMGYNLFSSFEYEFYVINKETRKPFHNVGNFGSPVLEDVSSSFAYDIMRSLKKIGIKPEKFHLETDASSHEITHSPCIGIKGPDAAMRYKTTVKENCSKHGLSALFMSYPNPKSDGSGAHFNFSLWDVNNTKLNIFHDPNNVDNLSNIALNWIAGLQEHFKALICIASPTVNCYERLANSVFIPKHSAWGIDNRSAAFRVRNSTPECTYIENRLSGSATNPYLLTAAIIIAGIDGINRNLKPSPPFLNGQETPIDVTEIPKSLEEALQCFNDDELFKEQFGSEFMKIYTAMKREEMKRAKANMGRKWEWFQEFYGEFI